MLSGLVHPWLEKIGVSAPQARKLRKTGKKGAEIGVLVRKNIGLSRGVPKIGGGGPSLALDETGQIKSLALQDMTCLNKSLRAF